jgi:glycosyltransferase involved in cell wall biosynthesis
MKISVVVPTYNEEANIVSCLTALRNQSLPEDEYEIIVVDGDSQDETRALAHPLADRVMIQTSEKVGGARNDGAVCARGEIIATTDADCIVPSNWLEVITRSFEMDERLAHLYGPVYPIEQGVKNRMSLGVVNGFARLGYITRRLYFTLGCNSAFDREAFIRAGMYRCIDAGDDLEIAIRMQEIGKVVLNPEMKVGFSMRRYDQFGTVRSIYEWLYIVSKGGKSSKYSYQTREYRE